MTAWLRSRTNLLRLLASRRFGKHPRLGTTGVLERHREAMITFSARFDELLAATGSGFFAKLASQRMSKTRQAVRRVRARPRDPRPAVSPSY